MNHTVAGWHIHGWRPALRMGVLHAVCVTCGRVTLNPRWPMWRQAVDG